MTITLADLQGYMQLGLSSGRLASPLPGGGTSSDEAEKRVVNLAGRWFTTHHPWNWRIQPESILGSVSGETYIDLPVDFGEMIASQVVSGLNYGIQFTTPQVIADRRATTVTITQNYYLATIVHPGRPNSQDAPSPPRIEVWPAFASTVANFFRLWYRSKWTELDGTTDAANVPDYCEFALALTCKAFATGLYEEFVRERDVMSELSKLVKSEIFKTCKETDGAQQADYGYVTGGAIQEQYSASQWSPYNTVAADPA